MKTSIPLLIAVLALTLPLTSKSEDKVKPYPLTTCIISGDKLGEMGKPIVITFKGQEVKFCCKSCVKDFNKDPDKYLKEIAEKAKK